LDAWKQFTAPFMEAFPDLRLTVEDIVAEGDTVAARVAFRGTHRGEFQGIPPTGKQVAFSSMVFNHVVDGKVEEHWVEMDLLRLMGQPGAIPEPQPLYQNPSSKGMRTGALGGGPDEVLHHLRLFLRPPSGVLAVGFAGV
jgi:hypothetical protein